MDPCPACGAVVAPGKEDKHRQWHIDLLTWLHEALNWATPGVIAQALMQPPTRN